MQTLLPASLQTPIDVLLIDNFDSFTYNLYQSFCLLGRTPTVIRNDVIPASLIPALKINALVISPGPGHPTTDSGISRDAIKYFTGKVPILGVCMGLECLVDAFGGEIACAFFLSSRTISSHHPQVTLARSCMARSPLSDTTVVVSSSLCPSSSTPPATILSLHPTQPSPRIC